MKKVCTLMVVSLLTMPTTLVYAAEGQQGGNQAATGAGMRTSDQRGMGNMMPDMQAHMKMLLQQMERINDTEDADTRDRLMEEHLQAMREHMQMMGRMGGGMKSGMMENDQPAGAKADTGMRVEQMERRMDMMQMMMDQMLERERQTAKTAKIRKYGPGKVK